MVWDGGHSLQAGAQSCHLLISPCFISSVQFELMRGSFQSVPSVHLHVGISKELGNGPALGIYSLKKITRLFLEQSCIAVPKATDSSAPLALHLHILLGQHLYEVKFKKSKALILLPYLIMARKELWSLLGPLDGNIGKDSGNCPSPLCPCRLGPSEPSPASSRHPPMPCGLTTPQAPSS